MHKWTHLEWIWIGQFLLTYLNIDINPFLNMLHVQSSHKGWNYQLFGGSEQAVTGSKTQTTSLNHCNHEMFLSMKHLLTLKILYTFLQQNARLAVDDTDVLTYSLTVCEVHECSEKIDWQVRTLKALTKN